VLDAAPWSNVVYVYWLFEPKTGRFVSSSAYNAAGLSSPTFNAENKQIISEWKAGCCLEGTDYYEVVDNKPVLVRQESYDQEKGLTVRERVGNEMKIVSEKAQQDAPAE
jgi:hypothetical protein